MCPNGGILDLMKYGILEVQQVLNISFNSC